MKIGMIFPGYSSQFVGMGKELYDESRVMQEYFEQASHCLDTNFVKLCFASSDSELAKMHNAYPSLFLVSSAIAALLKENGIKPDVVAGYGIGQYAAMHTINGLTFADGLYLLSKFSLFVDELIAKDSYAVARIKGCSYEELLEIIKTCPLGSVHTSSFEMPNQHLISGDREAVIACMQQAKEIKKVKVEELPIEYGLHSTVMFPVVEQFEVYFEKVDFKDVEIPAIANSSATLLTTGKQLRQELLDAEIKPILWFKTMQALHNCDLLCIVGPGNMTQDMFKQLYPNKEIIMVHKPSDLELVKKLILKDDVVEKVEQEKDETIGS